METPNMSFFHFFRSVAVSATCSITALKMCILWRSHGTTASALQAFTSLMAMNGASAYVWVCACVPWNLGLARSRNYCARYYCRNATRSGGINTFCGVLSAAAVYRTPWRKFGSRPGCVARALGVQSRKIWKVITWLLSAELEPSKAMENLHTCQLFCSNAVKTATQTYNNHFKLSSVLCVWDFTVPERTYQVVIINSTMIYYYRKDVACVRISSDKWWELQ